MLCSSLASQTIYGQTKPTLAENLALAHRLLNRALGGLTAVLGAIMS